MLMDETQAVLAQRAWRDRKADFLSVDQQLRARIGRMEPGQDLDEGRFARAVLPEQTVHLAASDLQADPVERLHAAETLRQVGEAQDWPHRAGLILSRRRGCCYFNFHSCRYP